MRCQTQQSGLPTAPGDPAEYFDMNAHALNLEIAEIQCSTHQG